ncbi:HPF/RaiA family ribosome-associated protein [Legionella fallonii]|uniref:Sigma 54 modulation protein YhbH n=1 Tax=Legionella fallonii LLAP-10 TaxID=1212491 RepID=A0A098G607_9GAMM|nr:HPF/RaiA family ribosome-associated protein [Legionella fallonii]CEG57887.1 conserved protein of unknown function [Legionella fallonii LLAP-10]
MHNSVHFPIHVVFLNFEHSQALEDKARKHAEKLGTYCAQIMRCDISIEMHRNHNQGNIYHIRIDLTVPNAELVVNRDPADNHAHENAYVAMRDAFNAIKRQLKCHVDKQRGSVKHHKTPPEGLIREIAPIADYGIIETIDGRRLRFNSKSVIDYDFNKLTVGGRVRFVEATKSSDGPAASTVYII